MLYAEVFPIPKIKNDQLLKKVLAAVKCFEEIVRMCFGGLLEASGVPTSQPEPKSFRKMSFSTAC
jgi:hypothetical protein